VSVKSTDFLTCNFPKGTKGEENKVHCHRLKGYLSREEQTTHHLSPNTLFTAYRKRNPHAAGRGQESAVPQTLTQHQQAIAQVAVTPHLHLSRATLRALFIPQLDQTLQLLQIEAAQPFAAAVPRARDDAVCTLHEEVVEAAAADEVDACVVVGVILVVFVVVGGDCFDGFQVLREHEDVELHAPAAVLIHAFDDMGRIAHK